MQYPAVYFSTIQTSFDVYAYGVDKFSDSERAVKGFIFHLFVFMYLVTPAFILSSPVWSVAYKFVLIFWKFCADIYVRRRLVVARSD